MNKVVAVALLGLGLLASPSPAWAITPVEAEAIYGKWLQHYSERQPELSIAMTSSDFIMVSTQTVMDRNEALAFQEQLAAFILSRECTNFVVAFQAQTQKGLLLLSRVDCVYHTVQGDLAGHFLETIIVNSKGLIVYDHFSDVANPPL